MHEFSNLRVFVRPILVALLVLASLSFAVGLCCLGLAAVGVAICLQKLFSLPVSRKMYLYRETLLDPRIPLVLPVTRFMIYYETFWFFQGLLTPYADEWLAEGECA